jgi:CRP/FNR family transcriptional regulator, cyclic AMP receptor protein
VLRKDAKVELLRRVPLFSGCSKRELGEIASLADELRFEAGRTLIQEGRRGHEFIVLVEGTVEVTKGGRKLRARGDDTFFGELALLSDAPRSATVTTTSPVRVLIISASAFQRLLRASPQIPLKMLKTVVERLTPEVV